MSSDDCILKIEGLNKYFGATHALNNLDFSLKRGEVRGLAGENGSGKSTLASIITGIYQKDTGTIYKDGVQYDPHSPLDAIEKKIGIVVQELGLINNLPVAENIFLGRTKEFSKFGIFDIRKAQNAAKENMKKLGLENLPANKLAGELSIESKKMVELVRAISIDPDILILDEVTQALSQDNRKKLYAIIDKLKAEGKSLIIVSHDLEELIKITDSITVMRDGQIVGTKESASLTSDELKKMMIGREINNAYYREDMEEKYEEDIVLEVKNINVENKLEDVSFELHKGEILGICGLSDAGIHDLGKAILGIEKISSGSIFLNSKNIFIKTPSQAVTNGVGYVPKDRDAEAMMLNASIKDNVCLPSIKNIEGPLGYISPFKLKKMAEDTSKSFEVKSAGILQPIGSLSGGNKQKLNLGRWLIQDLDILILDCPTRGVDVGVKAYIYDIMKKAKEKGVSMILISDELPEAMGMADRILILRDGKVSGVLNRSSVFTEESIIEVMI